MSKALEASQPPSYEEAMRGTDTFAGASAPFLSSPEHAPVVQPAVMPMPMPMPSTATGHSGPPAAHMQGMVHAPQMAAPSPQPSGMAPYPVQAAAPTTGTSQDIKNILKE